MANIFPSFISCTHIRQTFWAVIFRDWACLCGSLKPECFQNVCHFVRYPLCRKLPVRELPWGNFSDSSERECKLLRYFPYTNTRTCLCYLCDADTFSSSEAIFGRSKGLGSFLALVLGKKQTMSPCKEALDPRTIANLCERTFSVPLLRVKGAKLYKHSHCSLKAIF